MKSTMTTGQIQEIFRIADAKRMTTERMTKIISSGILADLFDEEADLSRRDDVRKALGLERLEFRVRVDYNLSLKQMIGACDCDWNNPNITEENFSLCGEGARKYVVELINFNRVLFSNEVEKELKTRGLRPAKIEELLAFGVTYPEEQRKFPIVALGSVASVRGGDRVAALAGPGASSRYLSLYWYAYDWHGDFRFLAVRN